MTKKLTIELPDDLEQQLAVQAEALNQPLEGIVLQTLTAVATLIQALQNADIKVRSNAAEALGKIGTEAAIPALIRALHDEDPEVHQSVVKALRQIGTEAAIVALNQASTTEPVNSEEFDPITPLIGTLHTGTHDLGENHDFYIKQSLLQELKPTE